MIELVDEVVGHKLEPRLAKMQREGRPGAAELAAQYARLNRRLRSAYIALGTIVETVHRLDRKVMALEDLPATNPPRSGAKVSRALGGGHRA